MLRISFEWTQFEQMCSPHRSEPTVPVLVVRCRQGAGHVAVFHVAYLGSLRDFCVLPFFRVVFFKAPNRDECY